MRPEGRPGLHLVGVKAKRRRNLDLEGEAEAEVPLQSGELGVKELVGVVPLLMASEEVAALDWSMVMAAAVAVAVAHRSKVKVVGEVAQLMELEHWERVGVHLVKEVERDWQSSFDLWAMVEVEAVLSSPSAHWVSWAVAEEVP